MKVRGAAMLFLLPAQMFVASATFAQPGVYSELAAADARLGRIGFSLITANADRCLAKAPGTGMALHSLKQYGSKGAADAQRQWTFPSPVSVATVVPGSPADVAGVRGGDGIEVIADQDEFARVMPGDGATAQRDRAEALLMRLNPQAPIILTIRRGPDTRSITVTPRVACRTRIELVSGSEVKARSDGNVIQIGEAFAAGLNDEELAVAVAHELAHTILQHRSQLDRMERAKVRRSERNLAGRRFEDEADLLSLSLLASAGFDPASAPGLMRRAGRRFDPLLPGRATHRTAEARAQMMEQAIAAGKTIQ